MQLVPIPKKLIEFLEFKQLHVLTVQINDGKEIKVITFPLPQGAKVGDRLEGAGVALQVQQSPDNAAPITSAILLQSTSLAAQIVTDHRLATAA